MGWFDGMGAIFGGISDWIFNNDAFGMADALRQHSGSVWVLGLLVTVLGGLAVMALYRRVPFFENYLEQTVMVASYLMIGGIIFAGVVQRFYLSGQPPWSTTLPPFLFLIMTWVGCSYNVKLRTHLAFAEFRTMMPPAGQIACLVLDAVLWLGFAWVVIVTTAWKTVEAAANFRFMAGTDSVMQWWFLGTVPLAFVLLSGRVFENLFNDLRNFREGNTLIEQAVIGGDA
ncbi:TRAP-type C4-dicarboxylate transport system, small permease component [Jannaschia faecimaris]|uniref:TRAP transporter small permease protein n=1 Tax=Jannaschia faecimaris TaxID=1244108 RepID=A0A1H3JUV1_9RHOB|nr:TRAP transporter small permease subunit [Jannaschia faecimaris]SDY43651.1 TRAP-type C4-dicarboxylate transport system, small permease component [Jannaschia faecimaris]